MIVFPMYARLLWWAYRIRATWLEALGFKMIRELQPAAPAHRSGARSRVRQGFQLLYNLRQDCRITRMRKRSFLSCKSC